MNPGIILIAAVLAVFAAHGADPLPTGWKPEMEGTTLYLENELEQGPAQQHMNRITAALAELADSRLAIVYLQLYALLPPKAQGALKGEEAKWLKARMKHADDAVESHGGSLAPTEHSLAYAEFTKERTAALEKRLTAVLKTQRKQP